MELISYMYVSISIKRHPWKINYNQKENIMQ